MNGPLSLETKPRPYPDRPGVWKSIAPEFVSETGFLNEAEERVFEVYPLDPAGGILCVWGPEIGRGDILTSEVWSSDEWLGHIPAHLLEGGGVQYFFMDTFDV